MDLLSEHVQRVKKGLDHQGAPLYYVHSDILHAFAVKLPKFTTEGLLKAHFEILSYITSNSALWFPAFNLSFPKTQIHDLENTVSEMGHLSEYFRTHESTWRDEIPMHSSCGTGNSPFSEYTVPRDAWGENSVWPHLIQANGGILFYGAHLNAISMLHYLERKVSVPYRYEKIFNGNIIRPNGSVGPISVSHIVRPMTLEINYDWAKIQTDLQHAGIYKDFSEKRSRIFFLPAEPLASFWEEQLRQDPMYFLDTTSRLEATQWLDTLGHPFTQSDFES